jgi:cyclic-di-GMP-binding biofilm dispersal mediator protein
MRALVTGAARGLGRALTEALLRQGYKVVAVDRDPEPLEHLPENLRDACTILTIDLASTEAIDELVTNLTGEKFDLVILNAGISATGKFEDLPMSAYERVIDVNARAPILLSSCLVGRKLMADKARLVFISSLSHVMGYPGASVYAATKDAIAAYARCVAKPYGRQGVRVLTVFPPPIRTDHAQRHAPPGADPSRRMTPDKLAGVILKASRSRAKVCYPSAAAGVAALFGKIAPVLATRMMRKLIFEKLEGPVY